MPEGGEGSSMASRQPGIPLLPYTQVGCTVHVYHQLHPKAGAPSQTCSLEEFLHSFSFNSRLDAGGGQMSSPLSIIN